MGTLTTVILRLLRHSPGASLRGTLQTLDDPEPRAFKDEQELLAHLRRLAAVPDTDASQTDAEEQAP